MSVSQNVFASRLVNFINASPSPFHAICESEKLLQNSGFTRLLEQDKWDIQPNAKRYVKINDSTIVAFAVGGQFQPGNGFAMIGAHSDSPCLRVKPNSTRGKADYVQLGVSPYGGGIWHTWFDRDLKIAGRVILNKPNGTLESRLVHIDKPLLRVPTMAIHLYKDYMEKWGLNKEDQILPVLALKTKEELSACKGDGDKSSHPPVLLTALSKSLGVDVAEIGDFELSLADHSPAVCFTSEGYVKLTSGQTLGGARDEFIFAPRLDNLFNAFASLVALASTSDSLADESVCRVVCVWDNEEVGSETAQGAQSLFVPRILRRLSGEEVGAFERACAASYMLSADQAHAFHPNYSDKYESNHQPRMEGGVVIKINANQRYATTSVTSAILKAVARKAGGVPLQEFVVRNDSPCGSTIGPIFAARLGIRTCDVGAPQLSMHSIREMCASASVEQAVKLYEAFFTHYRDVAASFKEVQ